MNDGKSGNDIPENSVLFVSAQGLKRRQSVRATFRLPEHIIKLLGIVASQLGIKQKSLFDQLVEDKEVLSQVAEKAQLIVHGNEERRQKTFVLSRNSLDMLDTVARQQNIPRDSLVEISIERLLPVIQAEQEKHVKRKLIYKDLKIYSSQGQKLLRKAEQFLGKDDPVYAMLQKIVDVCEMNVTQVGALIESGQAMEKFDTGQE